MGLVILSCSAAAATAAAGPLDAEAGSLDAKVRTQSRGFLPGANGARLFANMAQDQQVSEEMVIRILYRSLQEITAASGKPVTFQLSGFSTLYPADFSRVRWPELVTQPSGRRITIERVETSRGRQRLGVTYEPRWSSFDAEPSAELQALINGRNLRQLLAELAPEDKNLGGVVAATGYQVTLSFEGTSRTYNAAVLWLDPDRDGVVTLAVQDNITERAPRAALERQIQETMPWEDSRSLKATSCGARDASYSFPLSAGPDRTGHVTGSHRSSVRFNYDCHCDSTCRSTCIPSLTNMQCAESGVLSGPAPGTHKTRTSTSVVGGSKPNTDFTGADCGAGWACFIQFCPANVCSGMQIETSAQPLDVGIGVTFNASSQAIWDGQLNFPFQCDGCATGEGGDDSGGGSEPYQPENQYPTPPDGGGGGGGGCYWSCVPSWSNGIYYEECSVTCF
jgi:hypothetical protein